ARIGRPFTRARMSGRGLGRGAAESAAGVGEAAAAALAEGDGPGAGGRPPQARAASTESNGGMRRSKEPPRDRTPPHYALRWEGEGMAEDGRVAGLALAGVAPAPAGGGNRPGLVPLGGGGLERRPLGLHGAHDPARGPRVREQARLRPEGPLHDLAGGPLG